MNIIKILTLLCVFSLVNVSTAQAAEQDTLLSVNSVSIDQDNVSVIDDLDDTFISSSDKIKGSVNLSEFVLSISATTVQIEFSPIRAPPIKN
jgi:hypothetical protein